ncbi:sialidase [Puteibacter caeruleilacunae]|nr:sialidase [Puteibacter caeruleilacunae]
MVMKNRIKWSVFLLSLIFGSTVFSCEAAESEVPANASNKIDFVSSRMFNYPILQGRDGNTFFRFAIESTDAVELNEVVLQLSKESVENVDALSLFYTAQDSTFKPTKPFSGSKLADQQDIIFDGGQMLKSGVNYFWLSIDASKKCKLTEEVDFAIKYAKVGKQKIKPAEGLARASYRMGVSVRDHWDDNVHTYRIPGLTTTNKGTLLAIYDVRRERGGDLQGHIDIGLSRSIDGGSTWEPMRIVLDMGEWGGLPQKFNGVSDACILVDKNSEAIYVAGLWMHGVISPEGKWIEGLNEKSNAWNHQWRNKGSQPGFGVKQTSQFIIAKSTDDGKTWGEPVNLTKMCKKEEWWLWAPAPGNGITLKDGTLVFPTQGRNYDGESFSNITYSKDGGKTWITSKQAFSNTTECAVVELEDGSLMLNMRDNRNGSNKGPDNGRAIFTTTDMGEQWTQHPTHHGGLIEPRCMASLHKHLYTDKKGNKKSILFFSNPNSKYKRVKQTIKMSFDGGKTWPEKYWIELDEGRGAGYSCLTSVDEKTIGILYEGSQAHMTFQKVDISKYLD